MNFSRDPAHVDVLRAAGLKATRGRVIVYWLLARSQADRSHLTAEDIFRGSIAARARTSTATIYRTLAEFERVGLIERRYFGGAGFAYELSAQTSHDHLVNLDTGEVKEFSDQEIERRMAKIALEHGVDVVRHTLTLLVRRMK